MKMHVLNGGRLRMKSRIYVPDAGRDEMIELPVAAHLFRHPSGNVLFDTGCHPSVETDAEARWGGLARVMNYIGEPQVNVISGLAEIGLQPEDIDLVVNSHLHPDHCGCNAFFRKASFICHEVELASARSTDATAQGYLAADWDHPMPIETVTGSHDIFGDDKLVTIPLPGHTPGTIGMRAALEKSGEVLLVSDAVSLRRNLDRDEVPRNAWNADALVKSYAEIRRIEQAGTMVICGHDDGQWQSLRKGADAYE
jgi:glyoxylase-like metal-dependent hydrolase (beta-lactamase superfamily II)